MKPAGHRWKALPHCCLRMKATSCWVLAAVFPGSDMEATSPLESTHSFSELKLSCPVSVVNVSPCFFFLQSQDHLFALFPLPHNLTPACCQVSSLFWQQESGMDRRKWLIPLFKSLQDDLLPNNKIRLLHLTFRTVTIQPPPRLLSAGFWLPTCSHFMGQMCASVPEHPSSDPSLLESCPSSSPTAWRAHRCTCRAHSHCREHCHFPALLQRWAWQPPVSYMTYLTPGLTWLSWGTEGHSFWPLGCSGIESSSLARTTWARCSFLGMWTWRSTSRESKSWKDASL